MQICSDGHDEVVFASSWTNDCPACAYAEWVKVEMQEQIDELKTEIDEHECEES